MISRAAELQAGLEDHHWNPLSKSLHLGHQMSDLDNLRGYFSTPLDLGRTLKSTHYTTRYHRLQAFDHQADTCGRFPSSEAFFRASKRPICTICKTSYAHFYTWAEFWTLHYLTWLLRLQACYRQADTCVGSPSLRAFFRASKRPLYTIFKVPSLRFLTWAVTILSSTGYACSR